MRVVGGSVASCGIILACAGSLVLGAEPSAARPIVVELDYSGQGTDRVVYPAASGREAVAVDVRSLAGSRRLKSVPRQLPAGRYRVTWHARLHQRADDDLSKLFIQLTVGAGNGPPAVERVVWTQFDAATDRLTALSTEFTSPVPFTPAASIDWRQVLVGATGRARPIRGLVTPEAPAEIETTAPKQSAAEDDLLGEIEGESQATPLAEIDYPAVVLDRISFELLSGGPYVESVRPRFVHIYPGQANPIDCRLVNLERRPVKAVARLEVRAGLDEILFTSTQELTLPAGSATDCQFDWKSDTREFGHEARVSVLVDGQERHSARDYFSVSFPIWKTAIQGSGFITWHDRERQFPEHVATNRANYVNVEEAFSWQESSWTDLTPESDDWFTGQGDFHNTMAGLKQWIGLSHAQGIKMITYLWPSASGPEGLKWARENPELATHVEVGLATEFFDVEDLRLQGLTKADPRLWDLRSGIWNSAGINRGMLRAIDAGVRETVASAEQFGWDGARFDAPPGWGAMGAADMHAEFKQLKVEPLIKHLVPESFAQTTGTWSGEAVSICNLRYARHQFRAHNPHFALSFNFGIPVDGSPDAKFFDECCAAGGQIMDEEIRGASGMPWRDYLRRIQSQAEIARRRGGFHCAVAPNATDAAARCYSQIALFVGGSHPYLDFGWGHPLPGKYTQFVTRYGEYCWATDLAPTKAEDTKFSVADPDLWWRDTLRTRALASGHQQWVMHLVTPPPAETMTPKLPGKMQPWRAGVTVGRTSSREPIVWALSAEPETRAEQLTPQRKGQQYVVTIPQHSQWTVLVWAEAGDEKQKP